MSRRPQDHFLHYVIIVSSYIEHPHLFDHLRLCRCNIIFNQCIGTWCLACPSRDRIFFRRWRLMNSSKSCSYQTLNISPPQIYILKTELAPKLCWLISPRWPGPWNRFWSSYCIFWVHLVLSKSVQISTCLSFLGKNWGRCQKKTFFLGLCPKHRTPPTHRVCLGLHWVKSEN